MATVLTSQVNVAPAIGGAGTVAVHTFPFTPTDTGPHGYAIAVLLEWVTTNSRTVTVTAPNMTWTVSVPKTTVGSIFTEGLLGVVGAGYPGGVITVTLTFSGTIAQSGIFVALTEFKTNNVSPAWALRTAGTISTGSASPSATNPVAGGQAGDFFINIMDTTITPTGTNPVTPIPYLTYDTVHVLTYGDLPAAATVPANGFTFTGSVAWSNIPMVLIPGGTPPSTDLWVPPSVGMGIN
jgi:hypothetical protein